MAKHDTWRCNALNSFLKEGQLSYATAAGLESALHTHANGSLNVYTTVFNEILNLLTSTNHKKWRRAAAPAILHAALACPWAPCAMESELAHKKAGPGDIPCSKCGCKMVSWEETHRGDETGVVKFACSNTSCAFDD